jgi:lipoyl(octanoyl) transferase
MVEWKTEQRLMPYEAALAGMEKRVADIQAQKAKELVWLMEHPPIYTAGTSARECDLIDPMFDVYITGRGGQYTYHGPGQRVAYVMLDLKKRQKTPDLKKYVRDLEEWIIRALSDFDVQGYRSEGRVGIWVNTPEGEKKIAALGVRIRHWISFHGISINVNPDLSHYKGIVPCGISDYGVCSLAELTGRQVSLKELDCALKERWAEVFGEDEQLLKAA